MLSSLTVDYGATGRAVPLLLGALLVGTVGCSDQPSPTDPLHPQAQQLETDATAAPLAGGRADANSSRGTDGSSLFGGKITPALERSFDRSDYISQRDIDEAGGVYKLVVDGLSHVLVQEIRAPEGSAKGCLVDKRSLAELARVAIRDGRLTGPSWLRLNLYVIPEFDVWICLGLGAGCYVLVNPT